MAGMLLAAGYAALILFLLGRWQGVAVEGLGVRRVSLLFLLKVAAGVALWAIYTYVYPDRASADLFKYFDDGMVMYHALPDAPTDYVRMLLGAWNDTPAFDTRYYRHMNNWYRAFDTGFYNDAHTMIRYNALLGLFSFGQFAVHVVLAAGVATWGSVLLYRALLALAPHGSNALLVGIFLLPTVLLWSSGALKENLLMTGLGAAMWGLCAGPSSAPTQRAAALMGGIAIMLLVKSYVLLGLLPGALSWALSKGRKGHAWSSFAVTHGLLLIAVLVMGGITSMNVPEILARRQTDFVNMAREVHAGSLVDLPELDGSWASLLLAAPHALYMSFLSPLQMFGHGAMGAIAALEGGSVLILVVILVVRQRHGRIDLPLFLWCASFVLLLGLLIGWTTPVIGALVRYRLPILPFFILGALALRTAQRQPLPSVHEVQ
ncbi:MAG: hypothetical protein R2817_04825 [Flavobacteriales bacterium]